MPGRRASEIRRAAHRAGSCIGPFCPSSCLAASPGCCRRACARRDEVPTLSAPMARQRLQPQVAHSYAYRDRASPDGCRAKRRFSADRKRCASDLRKPAMLPHRRAASSRPSSAPSLASRAPARGTMPTTRCGRQHRLLAFACSAAARRTPADICRLA